MTASANLGNQPLADDPAQGIGQAHAHLFLLLRLKHTEDTVNGLAGVNRVKRAEHQVARFRGAESDLHSFTVTHFADKDDLRRLTQGGAQPAGKRVEIRAEFPLIESGFGLRVNKFDGILQRDDMDPLRFIDVVDQRRLGGGFS